MLALAHRFYFDYSVQQRCQWWRKGRYEMLMLVSTVCIAWHFFIFRFRQRHLPYVCSLFTIYICSHAVNYIMNSHECLISLGFATFGWMFFFSLWYTSCFVESYLLRCVCMFTMCIIACNPQKSTLSLIIVQKCKRQHKEIEPRAKKSWT